MDLEIIDSVTADSLESGDILLWEGRYLQVEDIVDNEDAVHVDLSEEGDFVDTVSLDPHSKIDIYGYVIEEF